MENIDKIKESLTPIAEKIGEGAEYTWTTLVQGQVIEGIGLAVAAFVCIAIFIASVYYIVHIIRNHDLIDHPEVVFPGCFAVLSLIFGLILTHGAILHLTVPEYMALTELISIVGGN